MSESNNVTIEAATNTSSRRSYEQKTQSGFFGGDGLSVSVGKQQQSLDQGQTQTTAAASTVGSVGGSVSITAGKPTKPSDRPASAGFFILSGY